MIIIAMDFFFLMNNNYNYRLDLPHKFNSACVTEGRQIHKYKVDCITMQELNLYNYDSIAKLLKILGAISF